jgi:predicted CXXCH cytochrome family protein
MGSFRSIKVVIVVGWFLGVLLWATAGSLSQSTKPQQSGATPSSTPNQAKPFMPAQEKYDPDKYVGSETCQACHEDKFKNFSKTSHARLEKEPSWKGKVVGCEACHGPGKAHVEFMSDDANVADFRKDPAHMDARIIALKKLSTKDASETCLSCHAGKEEHNNFRRGEHWRNDVGCTDCHSAHDPDPGPPQAQSLVYPAITSGDKKPDSSVTKMLRASEVQLCLKCHTEQRAQFNMPFHHKVMEGIMKCSDCHNPHGGFELKQTRLALGSDAACVKCHNDKLGPFVYEHAPLKTEGCTVCHSPHGSSNSRLLTRPKVFQLCIECHTNAHAISVPDAEGAPNTPTFHNLGLSRFQNCTTCHVMIHGSNSHPFFFR